MINFLPLKCALINVSAHSELVVQDSPPSLFDVYLHARLASKDVCVLLAL